VPSPTVERAVHQNSFDQKLDFQISLTGLAGAVETAHFTLATVEHENLRVSSANRRCCLCKHHLQVS